MAANGSGETPEQTARTWNVAYLAARILSLYLVAQALVLLASTADFVLSQPRASWPTLVAVGGLLGAGGIVWALAARIADSIWIGALPKDTPPQLGASEVQRIAFGIVGLLIVAETVPRILATVGQIIVEHRNSGFFEDAPRALFTEQNYVNLGANLVALGIGLLLLRTPDAVIARVQRFRRRDLDRLREMHEGENDEESGPQA